MTPTPPTLLAVAHGTRNPDGLAEIRRLLNIVRTKRPDLTIELSWLELAEPLFADALAAMTGPVVVVPVLLSTGYHVKIDIAKIVEGRPDTAVARQLGPDPRITKVVHDRLKANWQDGSEGVVLFSAGSSDPEAMQQLVTVAADLQETLRREEQDSRLTVTPRFLVDEDGWADGLPEYPDQANYLLAAGHFNDLFRDLGTRIGARTLAAPIGAHPLVAAVISDRFDEAAATLAASDRAGAKAAEKSSKNNR